MYGLCWWEVTENLINMGIWKTPERNDKSANSVTTVAYLEWNVQGGHSFWDQVVTSIEKWKEYKSQGLQGLVLVYHFTGKLTTDNDNKTVPQILKDTERNPGTA